MMEWTDARVKAFWDFYSKNQRESSYFTYQVSPHLIKHFKSTISRASNVLDYGCGKGFFLDHLLDTQSGIQASGLEFSEDSIKATQSRCSSKTSFEEVNSRDYFIENKKCFDLITCFEVIEHLDNTMLDSVFRDFDQLLGSDGRIIITTPYKEVLEDSLVYCPCCDHSFHKWQHVQTWSTERLTSYAAQYGFEVEHIDHVNLSYKYREGSMFFRLKRFVKIVMGIDTGNENNLCCVLKRSDR